MRNITIMYGFFIKAICVMLMCFIFNMNALYGQILTETLYSEKATFISNNTPTTPNGGSVNLSVGHFIMNLFPSGVAHYNDRSLVEFNTSNIGSLNPGLDKIIVSATLKLYQSAGTGNPQPVTARATASWSENLVTWSNQPAYQTVDEITTSSYVSGVLSIDVKDHVQRMLDGVYVNNGWVVRGNSAVEGGITAHNKTFYSDDYTGTASDPTLVVSYYHPMSVSSATINHTSSTLATDGAISPVLANGPGGTYTYQWFNSSGSMSGKTSLNLTGVPYGWYGLRVTSSVAGTDPFFYSFLVGVNCEEVSIAFNPGPDYIDDAVLNTTSLLGNIHEITNYSSDATIKFSTAGFTHSRSTLKFRLWLDGQLQVNDAILSLMASTVGYNASNPNAGTMYTATKNWREKAVTYSNQPTYSLTNSISIPELLTAPQLRQFDIVNSCELWQQNNTQNFGWLLKLNTEGLATIGQHYHSSDAASSSNFPKINFNIAVSNPVSPNYCNQVFAKMDRTLRGVLYKPYLSHLYFYYDEEYEAPNTGLNYRVYKADNSVIPVLDNTLQPLAIKYGDNRYTLDVSDLQLGIYVLEITNNKSEKFYLRFKVEN